MILEHRKNNRFLVYFFYDKQGIVDDYIDYMLQDISKCVREILFVSNGKLTNESIKKVKKYTDRIIERENCGFDVGAYKEALQIATWENLCEYDEVILMNYTIMGPVYPLQEMFDEMDLRDIDFWGPTVYEKIDYDPYGYSPYGYLPKHIQSHFIAIRNRLLVSKEFRDYWREMPVIENYQQSVGRHESFFTKHFADMGYKWDVYADSEEYTEITSCPCLSLPMEMIRDHKLPFFKRRSFMHDYTETLYVCMGEHSKQLYDYLENNTDYDVNMIWDNILRAENMADIKHNLHLNYVLSSKYKYNEKLEQKKVALIMHMHFPDLIDECLHYAMSMPDYADIYITTNSEEKRKMIEKAFSVMPNKIDIKVTPNRGRDVGPFLVESREYIYNYDYICHTHDKKVGQARPLSIGQSFSYRCFENVLSSTVFVENVIDLLEKNSRMGIVMPPPPNHSDYYLTSGAEWGSSYEATCELAEMLGINVPMSADKEPISPLGSVFWARTDALRKLFDYPWTYEAFPEEPVANDGTILHAVERIYSFAAQNNGYFAGWLLSENMAQNELTNLNYMLRVVNDKFMNQYNIVGSFARVLYLLDDRILRRCCEGKLYYDNGKGINEECVIKPFADRTPTGDFRWNFYGMEECGDIRALRFDPCDLGNVEYSDISVTIVDSLDNEAEINKKYLKGNGIKIKGRSVFIRNDPYINIELKESINIKAVRIVARGFGEITDETKEAIIKRL